MNVTKSFALTPNSKLPSTRERYHAAPLPMSIPILTSFKLCRITCTCDSRAVAPSAVRIPNSAVR